MKKLLAYKKLIPHMAFALILVIASFYIMVNKKKAPVIESYERNNGINSNGEPFLKVTKLNGTNDLQRMIQFAQVNRSPLDVYGVYKMYVTAQEKGIDPSVPFCIAWADSQLGRTGKGGRAKNPCNIAHYDRGGFQEYPTYKDGMIACVELLDRPQYRNTDLLGELSNGGRILLGLEPNCGDWGSGDKCWGTSMENMVINHINCVREIKDDIEIDFNYKFK